MDSVVVGYVILTYDYRREGRKWVGTCLELGTSTYANTLKAVRVALPSLVTDHLNLLESSGERIRFFDEWNIRLYPTIPDLNDESSSRPSSEDADEEAGVTAPASQRKREVVAVGTL